MKVCKNCGEEKPLETFGKDASTKDGLTRWCRPCRNDAQRDRQRDYRARNPEKYTPEHMRRWHLNHAYGITPEQFDEMLAAQGGRCAACLNDSDFCVDHDHSCCPGVRSCGECIRGILCRRCNMGIGYLDDDPDRLEALAKYLRGK